MNTHQVNLNYHDTNNSFNSRWLLSLNPKAIWEKEAENSFHSLTFEYLVNIEQQGSLPHIHNPRLTFLQQCASFSCSSYYPYSQTQPWCLLSLTSIIRGPSHFNVKVSSETHTARMQRLSCLKQSKIKLKQQHSQKEKAIPLQYSKADIITSNN
jgi:hypothetical protein